MRGVCRRVVLDSNSFRGSPVAEIATIRDRGFDVSVSHEAVREVWARSLRERDKPMLERRIASVAPYLDAENPVAFTGRLLMTMVGEETPQVYAEDERLRASLPEGWEDARRGLTDERWATVGKALDDELEREADGWEAELKGMRKLLQRTIDIAEEVGHDWYPRRRGEEIIENSLKGPVLLQPSAAQRLHLGRRLLAKRTIGS